MVEVRMDKYEGSVETTYLRFISPTNKTPFATFFARRTHITLSSRLESQDENGRFCC